MQKQRNIRLLISLLIITTASAFIFIFSNSDLSTSVDKTIFAIDNLDKVDRIVLESQQQKTELKFDGAKWRVNNQYQADDQMITVLFATLKQTQAKRQVATHLQDSIQKEIKAHGVKVSCFEGNELAKEFWSNGNDQHTETYFQLKDGKPYLVTIPGYRVYIASIFELPPNDWRDKRVFNFNWQNIKSLEVNFPGNEKQSFKASFNKGLFSLEGISTDTTKLDKFMDALFQLRVEKFLDSIEVKKYYDVILKEPVATIQIQDIAKQIYPLTISPFEKGNDFLIGRINSEAVALNPLALKEILRKKEYFIQK